MTDASDRPGSTGASSASQPKSPSSGSPGGGSRNRRRRSGGGNRSASGVGNAGSSGGEGSGGSGGTAGSESSSSGAKNSSGGNRSGQSRGANSGGGQGGGGQGGGGQGGGRNRSSSGNRRPSGQSGGRQGQGQGQGQGRKGQGQGRQGQGQGRQGQRSGSGRTGSDRVESASPPTPAVRADRTADIAEEAAAKTNRRRALLLCLVPGGVLGFVLAIVLVIVGLPLIGLLALVVVTGGVAAWIWTSAPRIVLSALGACPSNEDDRPRLHILVDGLCATMGLDRPAIAVVTSEVPNAIAVGRDPKSATLVVTTGLERALGLVELEGVLAHELVHIKRQDTVVSAVAVLVATPWAMVRGTPVGTEAVHALVGRGREFSADQRAALIVRYPDGIGSALETMVAEPVVGASWPPATGRTAALTRWLWVDPMAGASAGESPEGNLDDTRVRAASLALG